MVDDNGWCQFSEWLFISSSSSNSYMHEGRMEWPIEIARQHGHNIISDVTYVLYVLRNLSITVSPP